MSSDLPIPPGGLIAARVPEHLGLPDVRNDVHQRVLTFLDAVASPDHGYLFRENPDEPSRSDASGGPSSIETLVWAITSLIHVRAADRLDAVRGPALAALDAFHDPDTGLYQPLADQHKPVGSWRLHNDAVCRIGITLLGEQPRPWPARLDLPRLFPWAPADDADVQAWCESRWAMGPRRATKEIFQFVALELGRRGTQPGEDLPSRAEQALDFLECRRDRDTGLIGIGPGIRVGDALRGYRNMVVNVHWPLALPEPEAALSRIIDATLSCQRNDGLFDDGGMCANMDAVELLVEYTLRTGDQRERVTNAVTKCLDAIDRDLAHPTGGVRFQHPSQDTPAHALRLTNGLAFALKSQRFAAALRGRRP
ncbi:MAG: hypothetical protein ACOC1G_01315 [Phycisphaeraceae bacterium]